MRASKSWFLAASIAAIGLSAPKGIAADRDRDAVQRVQQQLQKVQREKGALQSEKTQLEAQLQSLQEKLAAVEASNKKNEGQIEVQKRALSREQNAKQQSDEHVERLQKQLEETSMKLKESMAAFTVRDREAKQLDSGLKGESKLLAQCRTDNLALYQTGIDILNRYENKGAFTSLLEQEPVTQLMKVKLENLVQDYRDKLDDSRFRN